MANILSFLSLFMILYCVYQLASLAGLYSEKSGVANVAIEGNMIVGAVLFALFYENLSAFLAPGLSAIIGIIISVPSAALFMMLLGILTSRYASDHIIAGTGMNLLAPVAMLLLYNLATTVDLGEGIRNSKIDFVLREWNFEIPYNGGISMDFNLLDFIFLGITIFTVVISSYVIDKSTFGLRLKSSGENPYSLETSGISVNKTRMTALYIAGVLSSLSGALFVTKGTFFFTVNGSGFLAIGILILGQYKVKGTVIGSLIMASFIGFFDTLPLILGVGNQLVNKYTNIFKMIPFIIPLIGLMIFRKSYVPKAVGTNFKKDQR